MAIITPHKFNFHILPQFILDSPAIYNIKEFGIHGQYSRFVHSWYIYVFHETKTNKLVLAYKQTQKGHGTDIRDAPFRSYSATFCCITIAPLIYEPILSCFRYSNPCNLPDHVLWENLMYITRVLNCLSPNS